MTLKVGDYAYHRSQSGTNKTLFKVLSMGRNEQGVLCVYARYFYMVPSEIERVGVPWYGKFAVDELVKTVPPCLKD